MADGKDIFGYSNKVASEGKVVSSPMVMVAITGGKNDSSPYLALVQQVNVQYARQMTPVYEIGSDAIMFNASGATGSVSIQRAVGENFGTGKHGTLLSPFLPSDPCSMQTIVIKKGTGTNCATDPGTVTATGMVQSVGITIPVGGALLTDNASYQIASLTSEG